MTQPSSNRVFKAPGAIERIDAAFSGVAFAPHRHDTYAIGVTLGGVQRFDYRGATRDSLPGDIVVLHPDEVHDGRSGNDDPFHYRTIYLAPAEIQSVLQGAPLPFIEGGVSSDARLARAVLPLLEDLGHPMSALEYQDALYDLATAMTAVANRPVDRMPANFQAVARARDILHERLDDGVSLEELQALTGHDRWELSRDFREIYGTSPYRYLVLRRLDRARALMVAGYSLADSAAAAGFADQSHLTRHFKKTWGLTPRAWCRTVQATQAA